MSSKADSYKDVKLSQSSQYQRRLKFSNDLSFIRSPDLKKIIKTLSDVKTKRIRMTIYKCPSKIIKKKLKFTAVCLMPNLIQIAAFS